MRRHFAPFAGKMSDAHKTHPSDLFGWVLARAARPREFGQPPNIAPKILQGQGKSAQAPNLAKPPRGTLCGFFVPMFC